MSYTIWYKKTMHMEYWSIQDSHGIIWWPRMWRNRRHHRYVQPSITLRYGRKGTLNQHYLNHHCYKNCISIEWPQNAAFISQRAFWDYSLEMQMKATTTCFSVDAYKSLRYATRNQKCKRSIPDLTYFHRRNLLIGRDTQETKKVSLWVNSLADHV